MPANHYIEDITECLDGYLVPTFKPYMCSTHKEGYVSMNIYVTNCSCLWDGVITKAHVIRLD